MLTPALDAVHLEHRPGGGVACQGLRQGYCIVSDGGRDKLTRGRASPTVLTQRPPEIE